MSIEAFLPLVAGLGFKKRAGGVFTMELAPGVIAWVGLNRASQHRAPGEVEINPVVGVRFQEVERVVAECRGEKFHSYQPPTICTSLGYLMPEKKYESWVFSSRDSDEVATDMANAIAMYGVPFMRLGVDLAELRRRLDGRLGFEHQIAYRRPIAALLAGDIGRAAELLDEALEALGVRTDLAATDFRKFAESLRSRLPSHASL